MSKYDDLFDETAPDDSVFADKGALDPLTESKETIRSPASDALVTTGFAATAQDGRTTLYRRDDDRVLMTWIRGGRYGDERGGNPEHRYMTVVAGPANVPRSTAGGHS